MAVKLHTTSVITDRTLDLVEGVVAVRNENGERKRIKDERTKDKLETRMRKKRRTEGGKQRGGWSKNSFRMTLVSPFTADLRRSAVSVAHFASKTKRTLSPPSPTLLPSVQIALAISLATAPRFELSGNFHHLVSTSRY